MDAGRELIDAVAAAIPLALQGLAGVEAIVREAVPADPSDSFDGVSATIRLTTGIGEGMLTLCFPAATAAELARRVLAETAAPSAPELVGDCMGEVANVVAGQAKSLLVGSPSHFLLSPPSVREGLPEGGDGWWLMPVDSDAGGFVARVRPPG